MAGKKVLKLVRRIRMLSDMLQLVIFGIGLGSIYTLITVGFSMIYTVGGYENLFHGMIATMGAYSVWFVKGTHSYIVVLPVALIVGALLGVGSYYMLRKWPTGHGYIWISSLIVAFIGAKSLAGAYTPRPRGFSTMFGTIRISQMTVRIDLIFMIILAIGVVIPLFYFIRRTETGKAIEATAGDRENAELWGIDTKKMIMLVFVLSGAIAGLGGVMYGIYATIEPYIFFKLVVIAFACTVFGGLGSLKGSVIASYILGLGISATVTFIAPQIRTVFIFIVIIIFVMWRPQGILGEA